MAGWFPGPPAVPGTAGSLPISRQCVIATVHQFLMGKRPSSGRFKAKYPFPRPMSEQGLLTARTELAKDILDELWHQGVPVSSCKEMHWKAAIVALTQKGRFITAWRTQYWNNDGERKAAWDFANWINWDCFNQRVPFNERGRKSNKMKKAKKRAMKDAMNTIATFATNGRVNGKKNKANKRAGKSVVSTANKSGGQENNNATSSTIKAEIPASSSTIKAEIPATSSSVKIVHASSSVKTEDYDSDVVEIPVPADAPHEPGWIGRLITQGEIKEEMELKREQEERKFDVKKEEPPVKIEISEGEAEPQLKEEPKEEAMEEGSVEGAAPMKAEPISNTNEQSSNFMNNLA